VNLFDVSTGHQRSF